MQTTTTTTATQSKKTPVRYAFLYCNSPSTQRQYPKRLKLFFDFAGLEGDLEQQGQQFLDQTRADPEWANERIMEYLDYHRRRVFSKEISPSTLKTMLQPIKTFLDAFDDIADNNIIKWKRIARSMPRAKHFSNDRIPTIEELRKLIEYPDRRIKAVVYTMCSSGIRIGAWEFLKWKHIIPIKDPKTGEVQAAKIIIYADEPEEHFSFVTPEAYNELVKYMEFRKMYGEHVTGESWLIRNYFKTADVKHKSPRGGNYGITTDPKAIDQKSLNRLIIRAWQEQGIRDTLEPGGPRRHQFKSAHSMRKYFKTRAEQVMNRLNVEFLMGHSIGLNSNYYRPTEQELLTDYLKVVPNLTINDTNVENLKRHQDEKDKELEEVRERQRRHEEKMNAAEAALDRKISMIQEGLSTRDKRIEDLNKLEDTYNQAIEDLRKTIRQTEEMKEFVLYHLDDKTRQEFTMRLQKITAEERKSLQEMKIRHKNEEELTNKKRRPKYVPIQQELI